MSFTLATWNINSVRLRAGLVERLMTEEAPDVLCLQEIKALPEQVEPALREPKGYKSVWQPAQRKGYSGVATFYRTK